MFLYANYLKSSNGILQIFNYGKSFEPIDLLLVGLCSNQTMTSKDTQFSVDGRPQSVLITWSTLHMKFQSLKCIANM